MPITRQFMGWDGPMLVRAAAYLREHHGQGGGERAEVGLLNAEVKKTPDQPSALTD
jgi:hypothetical protein